MKKFFIFLLIITSCSAEKRCQRHFDKAKELGCLKENDSTKVVIKYIKGDTIISYVPIYIDSNAFDSLHKKDTCYTKQRIRTIIQKLKITPVNKVDSNYNLQIWLEDGQIKYELKLPSRKDSIIYQTKYLEHQTTMKEIPNWLILLVCMMGIGIFIMVLKFI